MSVKDIIILKSYESDAEIPVQSVRRITSGRAGRRKSEVS
ncbi:hypothetical protein HMPREF1987_01026 [Peptostreptococcaceae bacterium oral taxon 113 str. W5053]|nr:hypothetical protein HMPREF1987_01026 [Peptostreptococcaceae bacterium oral taxon 113 str. W5053]